MSKLVGIVGGTGAGKSTLSTRLVDTYSDLIGMIQLDDYFKPESDVPMYAGSKNWDTPEAIYMDKFVADLDVLRNGGAVIVQTKNERLNPEYARTGKRISVEVTPKQLMIVEGFLVLWDERVRALLAESFFLDLPHDTRYGRRAHFKDPVYEQTVLLPMQEKYVEPTKVFATRVVDVGNLSADEVFALVEGTLRPYLVI